VEDENTPTIEPGNQFRLSNVIARPIFCKKEKKKLIQIEIREIYSPAREIGRFD